jgi:UDP-3-O-[3-hydroxymyristoyl] N-acetylglucosamine deacetylase
LLFSSSLEELMENLLSFCCKNSALSETSFPIAHKRKRVLKEVISFSGNALFTGKKVNVRILPCETPRGILFRRTDLSSNAYLPAQLDYVQSTPRCTILGGGGIFVQTVEHLLAALYACGIQHAVIEIDGPEIPIMDGSALPFVELLENHSVEEEDSELLVAKLLSPLHWSQGDIHLVALPSDDYRISYTLHYPNSVLLRSQFFSFKFSEKGFKEEIAPARTFSFYEEIIALIEKGVIKGGSLENAVLIKEDRVMNAEGLRFADNYEMVRHKILDLIGDLSLMGLRFAAHIIAIRSGHFANIAFAKELYQHIKMENA